MANYTKYSVNACRYYYKKDDYIANETCVSFCNQPKAHYLDTSRESRLYVVPIQPFCGCRHLATSRESKAHFGLPGYASGTIAVNVTWIEREFSAG